MADKNLRMQAPEDTRGSATIDGHEYKIPKDGKITVVNENHVETLKRHGFTDLLDDGDAADRIAQLVGDKDKEGLVEFIEERGHDADNSMKIAKLEKLARKAAGLSKE